ncbi:hypothetical protein SLEP1_g42260 [Rubroshorea leprosula]|uniref:Uncharacterized protein n=1 Tax=Rubroshorea leprosula TaxID=152421 RepID=A0AAV5LA61_9ROSI|nr:hypothetical protein SLEP1_g42260 [Rubroshorea leprosula]
MHANSYVSGSTAAVCKDVPHPLMRLLTFKEPPEVEAATPVPSGSALEPNNWVSETEASDCLDLQEISQEGETAGDFPGEALAKEPTGAISGALFCMVASNVT